MPATEPQLRIVIPPGSLPHVGPLEQVLAVATPPAAFSEVVATVDGRPVEAWVRSDGERLVLSAWCDSRGAVPGLRAVTVTGTLAAGGALEDTALLRYGPVEPVDVPAPAEAPGAVAVVGAADAALPEMLAQTATGGPPLVVLAPGCVTAPGAEARIAAALAGDAPVAEVVIGDEAAMLGEHHWQRWSKRGFESDALPALDHVGPLLAVGPRAAGILCDALPPARGVYDLALELVDRGLRVLAVPHVLALTPEARLPSDGDAERRAIDRLAQRRGRAVRVGAGPVPGVRDVRWPAPAEVPVLAVIPSRTPELAAACLAGLAERTRFAGLRAVLVDSGDDADAMAAVAGAAGLPVTHLRYPPGEAFNYQRAVNLGARAGDEEHVLFLNDDVVPLTPGWLARMGEQLAVPGVGVVGALLRYPDGRVQHAGVQRGVGTGHLHHGAPADARGPRGELLVPGNPEGVTGACMLVRRTVFDAIGGHDEDYVHLFGDLDLCLRAGAAGWRVAWCAAAELEHRESASYGTATSAADLVRFDALWGGDPVSAYRVRRS